MGHPERLGAGSRVLCQTAQRGGVGLWEDRTQDGPASGEKGSNVGPLARLYSSQVGLWSLGLSPGYH